jgi:hypothetical protein
MNVNEARPRTDREGSFGQDGHPRRSGEGGGMRDSKDHPMATFLRMKILKIAIVTLAVILLVPVWSVRATLNDKTDHLFFIERSKNKNVVQYDVQRMENNDLREPSPAVVYWVLEDGRQEGLTLIQRKYAYGIDSQEKLEKNKFRIILVVLKDRKIIIQRIDGSYKAAVLIGGKYSILEKVFVKSKEGLIGVPKVLYIDLFGWDTQTHLSTRERIFPGRGGH